MKPISISVCIPVFQGSTVLKDALQSIINQTVSPVEILILDDNFLADKQEILKTEKIISSFADKRIHYYKSRNNHGSAKTIKKLANLAKNEILFFLCQDDILASGTLLKIQEVFQEYPSVGVLTRPFFWFEENVKRPIRVVTPYDSNQNTILTLFDGKRAIEKIFESVGQISGLAYRKKYIDFPFINDTFTGHIYPFASVLKKYKCMFLKDYTVAVRVRTSQTRHVSEIYSKSPTLSWVEMFQTVFSEKQFEHVRTMGTKQITKHYVGLIQLKNYANSSILRKEITILVKSRWQNIFSPRFWFYVLITSIIPAFLLRKMTDVYKRNIVSKTVNTIYFPKP
ncbi:glycosyltransferase family 2 protein [Candidatus Gottesmanbacteria bacterium]|nr:glycosyltransferase family 2 protein [Candidatus Gottesmanbacteria bacterium]